MAIPCGYVGYQVKIVRERQAFLEGRPYITAEDSGEVAPRLAPWILRALGARSVCILEVWGRPDFERATSLFPGAGVTDMETIQQMPPP